MGEGGGLDMQELWMTLSFLPYIITLAYVFESETFLNFDV